MDKKIQLAQLLTESEASRETIFKELLCIAVKGMKLECQELDDYLQEHTTPFDSNCDWRSVKEQLLITGADKGLDEATMLLIYMEYLEMRKTA